MSSEKLQRLPYHGKCPHYDYDEFKRACLKRLNNVVFLKGVVERAIETLPGIKSEDHIFYLIANNDLENLNPLNSMCHDKQESIIIDCYNFQWNSNAGYMAFFKGHTKWVIKSFHDNGYPVDDYTKSPKMKNVFKQMPELKNAFKNK